jgi:hypothetical protein
MGFTSNAATAAELNAHSLRTLGRVQLLILDDWGLEPLDGAARHDPLEILEERYGRRSTIITSQIPVDKRFPLWRTLPLGPVRRQSLPHGDHRVLACVFF